ncbi:hypothetical protein AB3X89_40790, partial [Paraburkholderia sp. BR14320]
VNARVTRADGHAEREAAKIMINDARQALQDAGAEITLGADKGSVAVRPTLKLGSEFLSCAMKKTKTPRTTLAPGLAKVLKRLH